MGCPLRATSLLEPTPGCEKSRIKELKKLLRKWILNNFTSVALLFTAEPLINLVFPAATAPATTASSSSLDESKVPPLPFPLLRVDGLDTGLGEGLPACDTLRLAVADASTKPSSLADRELALAALPSAVWAFFCSASFRFLVALSFFQSQQRARQMIFCSRSFRRFELKLL